MKRLLSISRSKSIWFYFLCALAVFAALKVVMEIETILGWLRYFFSIIAPFVIGFGVAYILNIPCSRLQSLLGRSRNTFLRKRSKALGILITCLVLIALVVLVVSLIVPAISRSFVAFGQNFNTYYANAHTVIDYINSLNLLNHELSMDGILEMVKNYGVDNLSNSVAASVDALSSVFSAVFTTFLALVSSIYILAEKEKFKAFADRALRALLSAPVCNAARKYLGDLNTYFRQYIYCQTIDGCILGTLATIELFLLGSPYFVVLGVMLGIVNYIPYFGSIIGSLVAVAVVGFTQGLPMAVIAAAVLLITQQIDGNLIQPRLMGSSFALSPLLIIISITFGGSLGGPLGMICAIPTVAVLKNMLDDLITYFEKRRGLASGDTPFHATTAKTTKKETER